ncbi:MAG: flagellin [Holophaga sp.]|nr:flagellin [Holophaga sp.]
MTMRVANLMNNAQSLMDLQRIKQQYTETVQQLTTGLANPNLGDNPASDALVESYQSSINVNTQYVAQANTANSALKASSTALTTMGTDINSLLTLAQEGLASGTTTTTQAGIASQVSALRTDMISLGNTQVQGQYIFAGTKSTTVPFVDNTATTPPTTTYNGNGGIISLTLSPSVTVATNIPGDTLFYGPGGQGSATDLLAQTANLAQALSTNNTAGIQTAYDNLQAISSRVNVSVADLGERENGVTALQSGLTAYNQNLTAQESSVASVDYATAITQLNQESVAQQATLSTIAKTNSKNLFDYIA